MVARGTGVDRSGNESPAVTRDAITKGAEPLVAQICREMLRFCSGSSTGSAQLGRPERTPSRFITKPSASNPSRIALPSALRDLFGPWPAPPSKSSHTTRK
jgi:hypothetical protein